jgi:hypothetical protein
MGHRFVLLTGAIGAASLAGHAAVCTVSPLAVLVAFQAAALLALPLARYRLGFASIALLALASQVILHVVITFTSHAHGSIVPSTSMVMGHAVAALIIAAMAVRADAVVDFLQRITSVISVEISPVSFVRPQVAPRYAGTLSTGVNTHWSIRGPPICA